MTTQTFTDLVTLTQASWFNDADTATYAYLTSPAGTNTITATGGANLTYAAGLLVRWIPAGTNTGATTLNITPSGSSALGAKNVFSNGAACVGGEITSGVPVQAIYDGTQFNLLNPSITTGSTSTTFTWDGSGGTTSAVTLRWQKIGQYVKLSFPSGIATTTGTSSTVLTSDTALAAAARPVTAAHSFAVPNITNNGVITGPPGKLKVGTDGLIRIYRDSTETATFTNAATAGMSNGSDSMDVTYYAG